MNYVELKNRYFLARKEYHCVWCGEKILIKEKYLSRSYLAEGDFYSDKMHIECENAMLKSDDELLLEGFEFGEFSRGIPILN